MKSQIVKRSITIAGRRTSISLEDSLWEDLKKIVARRKMTLSALVRSINASRKEGHLSAAIRLYVLAELNKNAALDEAHPASPPRMNGGNIQS